MFDAILALTAIADSAIEVAGMVTANNQMKKHEPNNAYDAAKAYYESQEAQNRM